MDNFVALLLLIALGYGLRRVPAFPRDTSTSLNLFVIYVSLPAMILHQVPTMRVSGNIIVPILLPWAMLIFSAAAVLTLSRVLRWDRGTTGALLLVTPLGNTSFLGIPMVTSFFGAENVSYAVLYDQFGSFLALSTYGAFILAYYGEGARPSLRAIAVKILTFPPFIALVIALLTRSFEYPPQLRSAFKLIAASLVPAVMVAIGFQFRVTMQMRQAAPLAAGLSIKLALAPLLALLICSLAGAEGIIARVAVFEAAMPPMVTAGALAMMAGLAPELSAALIGWGILLSFITLPALHQLIVRFL